MGLWTRIKGMFGRKPKKIKLEKKPVYEIEKEQPKEIVKEDLSKIQISKEEPRRFKKKTVKKTRKKINVYDKEVQSKGMNTYSLEISSSDIKPSNNANDYTTEYGKMLKGKVQDKELFQDLIIHKEEILRKRAVQTVTLYGMGQETAVFEVVGGLPEDLSILQDYWINETVNSNEFNLMVHGYDIAIKGTGRNIISAMPKQTPEGFWVVQRLSVKGNFK